MPTLHAGHFAGPHCKLKVDTRTSLLHSGSRCRMQVCLGQETEEYVAVLDSYGLEL